MAHIRMRPTREQKTDQLVLALRRIGEEVELEDADNGVLAYYRAEAFFCGNEFMFPQPLTLFHFKNKYQRRCVNDLLVRLDLAHRDGVPP